MGCAVTTSRNPGVISSNLKTGPTVSSSGLYYEGSSGHFLERTQSGKDKGSAQRTSSGNSPDSARALQFPNNSQKSHENTIATKQRPINQESQDFSFKDNPEPEIEKENEKKYSTSGNPSLFRKVEVNSTRKDRAKIGNFITITPHPVENNNIGGQFNDKEVASPGLAGTSFVSIKENDAGRTPGKSEIDQAGLAFSFMNLRLSNMNQPTLFYPEGSNNENNLVERTSQYFNLARSSVFGVKGNEGEKNLDEQRRRLISLSESSVSSIACSSPGKNNLKVCKDNKDHLSSAQGSLSALDPQEEIAKDKLMPIPSGLGTTSTNVASHATVTSIANLCLDEHKRSVLQKRFTTNLVNLVKPSPAANGLHLNATKSLNAVNSIKTSELHMRFKHKVFSSPNLDFKTNLLSLTKRKQDEEDTERKLTLKREQTDETKAPNVPDRSLDLSNFDIPEDSNVTSPIAEGSLPNFTKSNTPKTLLLSNGNISFSRQVEGSTILDRTIYPLEDNITRIDLDKYSINVEMNERESLAGSPQKFVRSQNRHPSNASNYLSKAKSAILDSKLSNVIIPQKKNTENFHARPKSFCEIDQDKNKDTSSPGTECYLSPNRIPTTSFTRLPHERSMTDLNKTNSFVETSRVDKSVDDEGQKKINQYLLIKDLGKGGFGKVKLAIHSDTKAQYAVKIANKSRLKKKMLSKSKSAYTLLAKEVAIMKKMDHPNIVKLIEVIDDPNHDKLYIAMEFIKKGAVLSKNYWKHETSKRNETTSDEESSISARNNRLTEEKAKRYFRHLILALDYLHNTVGIIHRDIKPENLLIGEDDCLKVSDFGISEIMEGDNDLLDTSAGTKLYLAPETWRGKSFRGKPADIWAAGGTLYYLLTGRPPFQGFTAEDIKKKILEDEVVFPTDIELSSGVKNLIKACLIKDPQERVKLDEIMKDDWLTDNGRYPLENDVLVDLTPNEEDLKKALTKISFMAIVYVTATLKKAHRAKLNVRRKKTQEIQQLESRK